MSGWQRFCINVCLVTYTVHMASIPCWLCASGREFRRPSSRVGGIAPSEHEYWAARLFFVMAIADGVRGVDGLYDTFEDGSFVSVWGRVTIGARFIAWWIRDLLGFLIILVFHSFTLRWTHTALGIPLPWLLIWMTRLAFVAASVGFAIGLYGVLATNMQLWQVFCMVSVLPYNAMSCFMCGRHVWRVLPQIAALAPNSGGAHTAGFLARSRTTATIMFVAHAVMLSAFPALIYQKVAIGQNPLVAHLPIGHWLGSTRLYVIGDVPRLFPGKHPSPALEIVEITMGWFGLFLWWPLKGGDAAGCTGDECVTAEAIGSRLREGLLAGSRAKSD